MVKKETEYYGVLGIEPSASEAEIRIAYYLKARQVHPDKKHNDPQAADTFQKLGEAYKVLIDRSQREAYDRNGKHSTSRKSMHDSKKVFARLFGRELFKDYVGHLVVKSMDSFELASKIDNSRNRDEGLQVVQKETQEKLAGFLKDFFNQYVHGDKDESLRRAEPKAKRLSKAGVPESAQLQEDAQGGRGPTNVDRDSQMMMNKDTIANSLWNVCQTVLEGKDVKEEDLISRAREIFQEELSRGTDSSKKKTTADSKDEGGDEGSSVSIEEEPPRKIKYITQLFSKGFDIIIGYLRDPARNVHVDKTKSNSSK